MAIDWDRVVVESDDNGIVVSAGQVALLIGAEADTVTWGNITGDISQQPDLMIELDKKADVNSPELTGTPRSVTPPTGNSSNRIATTEFVQNAGFLSTSDAGDMAYIDDAPDNGTPYCRKNEDWAALGLFTLHGKVEWNDLQDATEKTIYVDKINGSDQSGTGHYNYPYATLGKAISEATHFATTTIYLENLPDDDPDGYDAGPHNITGQHIIIIQVTPSDPSKTLKIKGPFNVSHGILEFYGNLEFVSWTNGTKGKLIDAEFGSTVIFHDEFTIKTAGGSAESPSAIIKADTGSTIAMNDEFGLSESAYSLINACRGGNVAFTNIYNTTASTITVTYPFKVDGGTIMGHQLGAFAYTTFATEENGGIVRLDVTP